MGTWVASLISKPPPADLSSGIKARLELRTGYHCSIWQIWESRQIYHLLEGELKLGDFATRISALEAYIVTEDAGVSCIDLL